MRNLIFYRKNFVLTLVIVLLASGIQDIVYSQLSVSPDKIKDESARYVVWIVHEEGSGSGVLISKNYRLVVTNAHVIDDYKEVQVFFAVRDSSGNIVRAQPFYRNQDHQNTLQRLGYVTRGRVIAKYQHPGNEPDLAMIELDGFPGTASPLELLTSIDYSKMIIYEPVHILGHPAERPLWQSKVGLFQEKRNNDLLIYADAYYGNSGGPVLNKDGKLIGITRAINPDKALTFAVPASAIIDLYKTIEQVKIFSIKNNTELPMAYEIKWKKDEDWKTELLEPKEEQLHPLLAKDISTEYPKIRFEDSQNSTESSESIQKLETKSRYFGIGIKDDGDLKNHIEINDALRYQFMPDPETKKISLVKLKRLETFMIHNNTPLSLFFEYKWHEDEEWEEGYIKPSEKWRYPKLSEKVSRGYPIIRFDKIQGDREYPERNRSSLTLLTQTRYFDKDTEIREDMKKIGWNPPLYYQFKNNVGTNEISLEELKRTQRFRIQNPTDVGIFFSYRWHENGKKEIGYIARNATKVYKQHSEIDPSDSTEISYSENVTVTVTEDSREIRTSFSLSEDDKSAENIQKIETQIGYSNKNGEFVSDQYQLLPFEYHFKYNSKAEKLSFHEGLLTVVNKSTDWTFFLPIVLIAALIIEVVLIAGFIVFPKRHIFSIQNNTEATVEYQTKWTKKADWKLRSLEPGKSRNHWWTGSLKKVPEDYPKVQFNTKTDDKEEIKEHSLGIYTWRLGPKAIKKISRETHAREYHFEIDSETKAINLVDSEKSD